MKGNKIMSQQKMKFRFIAFFLAVVFALSMLSLPVWAEDDNADVENVMDIEDGPNVEDSVAGQYVSLMGSNPDGYGYPPLNTSDIPLGGDLLIGKDTEHDAIRVVKPGETFAFTGKLFVDPIRKHIDQFKKAFENEFKAVYKGYLGNEPSENLIQDALGIIALEGTESDFKVTLHLDPDLEFTDIDINTATFTENDLFKMTELTAGPDPKHDVTATMFLKKDYKKFIDLHTDVTQCPDLELTIPGVLVSPAAKPGTKIKAKGTVTGSFDTGTASFSMSQFLTEHSLPALVDKTVVRGPYKFDWKAIQKSDGLDFDHPVGDTESITYTVIVKPVPAPEEEQDILIPCPYPCQVPPMWNPQPQPSQVIQQVQPMPQAPVQNVDAAQAPIQLPKTGEKRPQPLSLFFLLSASALFLLRRKMR